MCHVKRLAAVLLVVFASGWLVLANAKGKQLREVEIDRDDCSVDAEVINVSLTKHQHVRWVIDADATSHDSFRVSFPADENPCENHAPDFTVQGKAPSDTCKIRADADFGEYEYSIFKGTSNDACNDPSVDVQNGRKHRGKHKPATIKKPGAVKKP